MCFLSLWERGRGLSENLLESLHFDYMRIANLQLSSFYQSIQEEWNFFWNYALKKKTFQGDTIVGRGKCVSNQVGFF